jgi:hypothetical protein
LPLPSLWWDSALENLNSSPLVDLYFAGTLLAVALLCSFLPEIFIRYCILAENINDIIVHNQKSHKIVPARGEGNFSLAVVLLDILFDIFVCFRGLSATFPVSYIDSFPVLQALNAPCVLDRYIPKYVLYITYILYMHVVLHPFV